MVAAGLPALDETPLDDPPPAPTVVPAPLLLVPPPVEMGVPVEDAVLPEEIVVLGLLVPPEDEDTLSAAVLGTVSFDSLAHPPQSTSAIVDKAGCRRISEILMLDH